MANAFALFEGAECWLGLARLCVDGLIEDLMSSEEFETWEMLVNNIAKLIQTSVVNLDEAIAPARVFEAN